MKWTGLFRGQGILVEVIRLSGTSHNRDGQWIRVLTARHHILVCQVRTVPELTAFGIDLSTLEEM